MSAQVWMAKYGALRTTPEAAGNGCAQQTVSVLLEEGCTLCDQGEFDAAQACFRAVVQQCPDWAVGHNNLGWALQQSGRNEDAISSYKAAINLQPAFDLARANLAFCWPRCMAHGPARFGPWHVEGPRRTVPARSRDPGATRQHFIAYSRP
ncbi:tetratricopeptide repeat protein [Pseudomonas qingdaonensis]|nr:tetratricopeptide repeat protein [Pseudomonas qingdaonensis]